MIRALAVSAVLVLAACSSNANTTSTRAPAPSVEDAVKSYVAAFGAGDGGAAWAAVSDRCRGSLVETDYRATVAASGVKYKGLHVTRSSAKVDGTAATVNYATSSADLSYPAQRWVLERGAWRWDGC